MENSKHRLKASCSACFAVYFTLNNKNKNCSSNFFFIVGLTLLKKLADVRSQQQRVAGRELKRTTTSMLVSHFSSIRSSYVLVVHARCACFCFTSVDGACVSLNRYLHIYVCIRIHICIYIFYNNVLNKNVYFIFI